MSPFEKLIFPNNPPNDSFGDDRKCVIVGVIGKSSQNFFNKMSVLNILEIYPTLSNEDCEEGQIKFYWKDSDNILYVHFETTYDNCCMQKELQKFLQKEPTENSFLLFNNHVRDRFARSFLFATEICHIIVFLESSISFDATLLQVFKCLKIIREKHVLKFLPKFLKNSTAGSFLGKDARLCAPRVLFYFENYPDGYDDQDPEAITKLEFEVENNIYRMLRNEFIITNNSSASLFAVPLNNRFVYFNTGKCVHEDPLLKSIQTLNELINKSNIKNDIIDELDELRPYEGFGKPLKHYAMKKSSKSNTNENKRTFLQLLNDHVDEAFKTGFDDNMVKYKSKNHFVIPSLKAWYDTFKLLHKIFISNPDNPKFEANDPDYKSYLENFYKIMDIDDEFFAKCCDTGLKKAISLYNDPMLTHYGTNYHKSLVDQSIVTYLKYARGPHISVNEKKLKEKCDQIWKNGKQQCEFLSLRCNPCIKPKHNSVDLTDHSSGNVFLSACNCGRTTGHREDPYTLRQANYEFYQILANNCSSCSKIEKINFAVFEPSINDFKPAEIEKNFIKPCITETAANDDVNDADSDNSAPLTASQRSHTNLSLESMDDLNKINCYSSDESVNELVIKVGEQTEEKDNKMIRQASTTEYLAGMTHTESPIGLLPQYPSWSLVCLGLSSIYSHNTGLSEHFQNGFLSGTNYLLPWDVHVRIEHSASWAAAYEKTRYRKKGEVIILKIFIGCEYECPRGHRFIMSSPDKVLRGGSGIVRDSGSKVVFNDMPLYFPCPCKNMKTMVAQLMRVHIVTPKAPVNVILEPKVRTGDCTFTMGLPNPPKLTQSAYWVLRLPYIYQDDDGPIFPPSELTASNSMMYGCLLAGMYGVSEVQTEN